MVQGQSCSTPIDEASLAIVGLEEIQACGSNGLNASLFWSCWWQCLVPHFAQLGLMLPFPGRPLPEGPARERVESRIALI